MRPQDARFISRESSCVQLPSLYAETPVGAQISQTPTSRMSSFTARSLAFGGGKWPDGSSMMARVTHSRSTSSRVASV